MSAKNFSFENFKEKLDATHAWPSLYTFKFIVPKDKVPEVESLFPMHDLSFTPSSKGTYISVTARIMASSSDQVIEVYQQARNIEGIISL